MGNCGGSNWIGFDGHKTEAVQQLADSIGVNFPCSDPHLGLSIHKEHSSSYATRDRRHTFVSGGVYLLLLMSSACLAPETLVLTAMSFLPGSFSDPTGWGQMPLLHGPLIPTTSAHEPLSGCMITACLPTYLPYCNFMRAGSSGLFLMQSLNLSHFPIQC